MMINSNVPFIDFHNHSMWNGDDTLEVVSVHYDQEKNLKYYTIGFHPWWTKYLLDDANILFLKNRYLHDPFCLGIGEFGMDNLKGAPIDLQEEICIQQIELANEIGAPIVLHCVRAFDRLLRLKKQYSKTPWAIHGFVRNKVLVGQILDVGINLSVAPSDHMSPSFHDSLTYIPLDRIFLETDSDFRMNIKDRYSIFATIRNIDVIELRQHLYNNFINFYSDKWKHQIG